MNKLNAMGVGVEITSLELTQVAMPEEVRAVYENVNAARLQANTIIERAYQFQATMIPQAESEAHTMVSNAKSAKTQAMAAAKVELAEFWGVVDEYMTDEKGVKNRLYNERLKRIFEKIGKVYVVDDEAGQKPAPSP
jgi:membrane protease subunit HflK